MIVCQLLEAPAAKACAYYRRAMLKDMLVGFVLVAIPVAYFLALLAAGEDSSGEGNGGELQTRASEK